MNSLVEQIRLRPDTPPGMLEIGEVRPPFRPTIHPRVVVAAGYTGRQSHGRRRQRHRPAASFGDEQPQRQLPPDLPTPHKQAHHRQARSAPAISPYRISLQKGDSQFVYSVILCVPEQSGGSDERSGSVGVCRSVCVCGSGQEPEAGASGRADRLGAGPGVWRRMCAGRRPAVRPTTRCRCSRRCICRRSTTCRTRGWRRPCRTGCRSGASAALCDCLRRSTTVAVTS